jgi:hypothetical protein
MKTILFIPLLFLILFIPKFNLAQYIKISGNVISNQSKDTIKYASVFESFSEIGTITNQHGFFSLRLRPGKQHLIIKEPGFKICENDFYIRKDTTIQVLLEPRLTQDKPGNNELQAREAPEHHKKSRRNFIFF